MHITIRFFDGRLVDAVVLAVGAGRMRISLPGNDDAKELAVANGTWVIENHEPVELEALVSGTDLCSVLAEIGPRAQAAHSVV